jgi:hypothetical protein
MPDLRAFFRSNVRRVQDDAIKASDDLVRRLKRLTPGEFLRQSPRLFAHLTPEQYRDIVGTIAPQVRLPASPTVVEIKRDRRKLADWWRERSVLTQSGLVTISMTLILSAIGMFAPLAVKATLGRMEVVRPTSSATWPVCKRLSEYTDGCIYYPAQDLNWDWVALKLGLPVEVLRRNNRHLTTQWVPVNAPVVIWRERGRLEK